MTRPLIPFLYDELRLPEMLTFIGVVLRRVSVPIFRMKDRLVLAYEWETPSSESADEKLRRADGSLMLDTVNSMKMHEFIVEHVPFRRLTGSPPKDVVSEFDTGPAIADALNGAQIACNPKALGIYLSRHNGRTVDGLRLDTAKDKHAKVLTFRITQGD